MVKKHRYWHLEVRLEFTEVASEEGGILMGTDTTATEGSATRYISSALCLLFVSLQFPIGKRGLSNPGRVTLHGGKSETQVLARRKCLANVFSSLPL